MMSSKEWIKEQLSYTDDHWTTTDRIMLTNILKDLERLEKLESNSDKVIKDSVKLINKNLELQQRLEVLEKENEQLKGNENIVSNYAYSLKEENEKLKKAIKLLKYLFDMDLELCSTTDEESIYLLSGDCYIRISSKAVDVDLLNEVLGK